MFKCFNVFVNIDTLFCAILARMSVLNHSAEETTEERRGYLSSLSAVDKVEHQKLILQRAETLAKENSLKNAVDMFSMAFRCGSVRPEQLGSLVDCFLRNYKKIEREKSGVVTQSDCECDGEAGSNVGALFDCPGCHRFLSDPVTIACGHIYCKRCLQRNLFSKCRICKETIKTWCGEKSILRPNVMLCSLLEKWFPDDVKRSKVNGEIEEQVKNRQFEKAAVLVNKNLDSDPDNFLLKTYRAEIYAGLEQYTAAIEDLETLCVKSSNWPERYFRKGKILHDMGHMNESLQLFLQCLALDEDFAPARTEVEKILCDLLSPVPESVKKGLRETTLSSSPHLRWKTSITDAHSAGGFNDMQSSSEEKSEVPNPSEGRETSVLNQAQSLRVQNQGENLSGEEGLERVSSATQLFGQEKGGLLKRKLSASEQDKSVFKGRNKQKKQGDTDKSSCCRAVPKTLLDVTDFECSLCMRLFYEPVTTPCGHTFCKNCLERCLDHTPQCPLCKESLKEYLASRKYNVTRLLEELIHKYLPEEHSERKKVHLEETVELSDLTKNVPVFVCTMAYPTVPCPLHVFEPRYRLMIRRCMETGTRQFGMCISDAQKGFVDYGCMLQIRSVHFLPDGRSVVDTIGGKRFKVLERGMRDGYFTANIAYLEDVKANTSVQDEGEFRKLQELHDQVYMQACTWFQNLKNRFRGQILQHFGPMPEREEDIQATPDGPACCWWLLAVLPVDPRYQLSVLSMMSLKERLLKIQYILTYLQSIPSE
ncbi:LON peptidase N-terminal domain and ring finger 1, like isoform X1 [Polyodon spathula]|uniref:LON peptidase N-terminal domain and ring finger 1, like isoform X1 n=1 Tax=Polyodon spathula TaxID=7913 RepID=UPI001B7DD27C|nr:LON peptidase N-terminal domain and ring finger 1, like isoform X1 [Polyodon spathula]